ncbi:MAG TPA: hypothetical protein VGQ57_01885 [Polyangiaceae bacterium]|jgi:hypothetical protein|nr:hypothetical protein [Polyangiaceae bacterium]
MTKPVASITLSALLTSMTAAAGAAEGLPCRVLAYREAVPPGLVGSYVALTGPGLRLQVGFLSDVLGWQSLGRRADDGLATLSKNVVLETASRFVTSAASALCRGFAPASDVAVGLPLFVEGGVAVGADVEVQAADIVLGSTRALLVVFAERGVTAVESGGAR